MAKPTPLCIKLNKWFLIGGSASPEGCQIISRGERPLHALQHAKFDQQIYPKLHLFLQLIWSHGTWNNRKSLKEAWQRKG